MCRSVLSQWPGENDDERHVLKQHSEGDATLIQAWVVAGQPLWNAGTLGSYECWAEVMGGILEVNGVEGFLGNLDDLYEASNAEGSCWALFVEKWWEKFDQKAVGVGELVLLAEEAGLQLAGDSDHSKRISLGTQLRQHRDQVIGTTALPRLGKFKGLHGGS